MAPRLVFLPSPAHALVHLSPSSASSRPLTPGSHPTTTTPHHPTPTGSPSCCPSRALDPAHLLITLPSRRLKSPTHLSMPPSALPCTTPAPVRPCTRCPCCPANPHLRRPTPQRKLKTGTCIVNPAPSVPRLLEDLLDGELVVGHGLALAAHARLLAGLGRLALAVLLADLAVGGDAQGRGRDELCGACRGGGWGVRLVGKGPRAGGKEGQEGTEGETHQRSQTRSRPRTSPQTRVSAS